MRVAVRLLGEFFRGGGGDVFEFSEYLPVYCEQWGFKGFCQAHIINHEEKKGTKG